MVTLPIPLPSGYYPKIQVGNQVTTGEILAKREVAPEIVIRIPEVLKIPIKHSAMTLRKNPGDSVQKGTILASKKRTFGINEDVIVSQVDGIFLRYERDTGAIVITPDASARADSEVSEEIRSPIDGIVEVCDNDKILLRTDKDILLGKSGVGKDFTGIVHNIAQSQEDPEGKVQLHFLDSAVIGTIIVGGSFDRDVLLKAIGMGVGGVIAYSIRDEDLSHIADRNLSTPVITIEKESYLKLLSWNGKKAYIQGEQKTILLLHL